MTPPIPERYVVPVTVDQVKKNLSEKTFNEAKITNIFSRLYHLYHGNVAAITVTSGKGTTKIYLKKDVLNKASENISSSLDYKSLIKQTVLSIQSAKKSTKEDFEVISNKILRPLDSKGYKQTKPDPDGYIELTLADLTALNIYLTQKNNATVTDTYRTISNKLSSNNTHTISRRELLDAYEFPTGSINNKSVSDMRDLQKNIRIEYIKKNLNEITRYMEIATLSKDGIMVSSIDILNMLKAIETKVPETKLLNDTYTIYLESLKPKWI